DRCVNSIHTGIVVDGQRLVVGKAAKHRLGIVGTGCQRVGEVEDVLIEERHLHVGMGIVEIDGGLQSPAGDRHAGPGSKVCLYVITEIEQQNQQFAVSRGESEASRVEIDYGGARGGKIVYRRLECVKHYLRCGDKRVESIQAHAGQA